MIVWGVDTSTKAVDICAVEFPGTHWGMTANLVPSNQAWQGAQSCANAALKTRFLAIDMTKVGYPDLVVVESPFVRGGGQSLMMNYGVILGALGEIVGCPILEVASATWKAYAPGHGHAKKPAVWAWAVANGWEGQRQDLADAFCMAHYGADLLRRRSTTGGS